MNTELDRLISASLRDPEASEGFSVDVAVTGATTRLRLRGNLDAAGVPALRQELETPAVEHARVLVVDATDVTFYDSSGLQLLLRVAARCARDGKQMRLYGANGVVARVVHLTGTAIALDPGGRDDCDARLFDDAPDRASLRHEAARVRAQSVELRLIAQDVRARLQAR